MPDKIDVQHIAVKALIVNDAGEVLVLQQAAEAEVSGANRYHPPGGIVEFGESLHQALEREVQEEINCDVTVNELVDVKEWQANIRGQQCQFFGVFYKCQASSTDFTLDEAEVAHAAWVNSNNLDQYDILEPSLSVIKKLLKVD